MGRHFFYVKNVKMLASFNSFYYLIRGLQKDTRVRRDSQDGSI
jgi:hypothetical protein